MADQDQTQGRSLSRYRLLEEVGQGGMAVVYKGFDTTLHREVAVKVLHPHLAGMAESRARLQREAHAVAKLRHENILEIFDYSGPDSPESYIVTEFIHGATLKNFLADHPLPFPEVAEMIASEVARALEHAHALGVIHRDIKPENVMIRDDGLVKLMDFGIAQIVDKERMTVTGQLLGSPAYMAPEHVEGKPLDFRTDVFAVGILLYQLATGQLPFRGKNPHEVLKRIAECKFAPPESVNPKIGARLGRVIGRALRREPEQRYPDVTLMRAELLEDLADAGIDDPRKELQGFFRDPDGWARAFQPRLVAQLARRGKELADKGRAAAALELWSRALAVEPKSSELRALVDGMARRRHLGRAAVVAAAAVLVASAGAFGWQAWQKRPRAAAPTPVVAPPVNANVGANANQASVEKSAPPAPVEKSTPAPVHKTHPAAHPRVADKPPAQERHVKLFAKPAGGLMVALDEAASRPYDPDLSWDLDGKPHVFHLDSPYLVRQDRVVAPDESGTIKVAMRYRIARLVVNATPDNADVQLENRLPVPSGTPIDVPLDESSEGQKEVTVKVSAAGYGTKSVKVQVGAGQKVEQKVALEKRSE
jgi:serine/threonine-protein kinase